MRARPSTSRSPTSAAFTSSCATAAMPPAVVATSGGPRRQRLHHHVGQPVHVARVVADRGDHRQVGGGEVVGHRVLREHAGEDHLAGHALKPGPLAQFVVEVARAADDQSERRPRRRQARDGVDEVLEPLLAHEAPGREQQRVADADAEPGAQRRARLVVRPEAVRVHPVGNGLDSIGRSAQGDGARPKVVTACGRPARAPEHAPRDAPGDGASLRQVGVGAVQAHHQRELGTRRGARSRRRGSPSARAPPSRRPRERPAAPSASRPRGRGAPRHRRTGGDPRRPSARRRSRTRTGRRTART